MTDGSVVLAVIRLLVSLAVVLVLLVALARWASRRGIGSARPGRAGVEVEVLSRRSLGRSSTLQVVKVGTQVMVLGVTDRGVSVLGELGPEDLVPAAAALSVVPSAVPATGSAPTTYEAAESRAIALASVDSRSATRSTRRAAAAAPAGWPWNAAALVLGAGRSRRG
ncbi:MAG: flagellar biosynthetic protein FliO [Pedococcus sp.]